MRYRKWRAGSRYEHWTLIEDTGRRDHCGYVVWRCVCDCGTEVTKSSAQFRKTGSTNCGCIRLGRRRAQARDLAGRVFGRLRVCAEASRSRISGVLNRRWRCLCSCGAEIAVLQRNLLSGMTKSCGCLAKEKASAVCLSRRTHGRSNTPEYKRHIAKMRRVRILGAEGSHTHDEWIAVCVRQYWRCAGCREDIPREMVTKDHVVPLKAGGTDYIENIQMLCRPCNSSKGAKLDSAWRHAAGLAA